jgi:pyrroline-5-carboxylate reductase
MDNITENTLANVASPIVLVGAGRMGGALLQGWLNLGLHPTRLAVIEPEPSPDIRALAARGVRLNPQLEGPAEVVVLAVKPQMAAAVLPSLAPSVRTDTLLLSIMAGRSISSIAAAFDPEPAIVRAMPNTPAAIGRGITVAVPNHSVTAAQRETAHRLLSAGGAVEWVDDETLIDPVTAVSGSGPAYVFLLAEALAAAGVAAGLPAELAAKLARETVAGAGELLHQSSLEPSVLRENVTSPGGTTAAALGILMGEPGLRDLMQRAVEAATRRSRELGG